jgi:flagellar biosynthesis chaperone FliJ
MQVKKIKEQIATMSASELAEVEAFIHELRSDRATAPKKIISFEEAAEHVRTDYAHLLHRLSQ